MNTDEQIAKLKEQCEKLRNERAELTAELDEVIKQFEVQLEVNANTNFISDTIVNPTTGKIELYSQIFTINPQSLEVYKTVHRGIVDGDQNTIAWHVLNDQAAE